MVLVAAASQASAMAHACRKCVKMVTQGWFPPRGPVPRFTTWFACSFSLLLRVGVGCLLLGLGATALSWSVASCNCNPTSTWLWELGIRILNSDCVAYVVWSPSSLHLLGSELLEVDGAPCRDTTTASAGSAVQFRTQDLSRILLSLSRCHSQYPKRLFCNLGLPCLVDHWSSCCYMRWLVAMQPSNEQWSSKAFSMYFRYLWGRRPLTWGKQCKEWTRRPLKLLLGEKKKREFKLVLLGCLFLCELWRPNTLQGLACNSSVSLKVHMCQSALNRTIRRPPSRRYLDPFHSYGWDYYLVFTKTKPLN